MGGGCSKTDGHAAHTPSQPAPHDKQVSSSAATASPGLAKQPVKQADGRQANSWCTGTQHGRTTGTWHIGYKITRGRNNGTAMGANATTIDANPATPVATKKVREPAPVLKGRAEQARAPMQQCNSTTSSNARARPMARSHAPTLHRPCATAPCPRELSGASARRIAGDGAAHAGSACVYPVIPTP